MKQILLANLFCLIVSIFTFSQTEPNQFKLNLLVKLDANIDEYGKLGFSPTGKYFFAVDNNKMSQVWETDNQKLKHNLKGKFTSVQFSPNEKWLAVFSKKEAKILETETGRIQTNLNNYTGEVKFLNWSPNNKTIAIGTNNFTVDLWNAETGILEKSFVIHEKTKVFLKRFFDDAKLNAMSASFSPDGKRLLTNCNDREAELWDLETGKLLFTFRNRLEDVGNMTDGSKFAPASLHSAKISSDGRWIATTSFGETRLWNAETGILIDSFEGFAFPKFSPNDLYLGMLGDSVSRSPTKVFDLIANKAKLKLPKYVGNIVVWSSDSQTFITDRTLDEVSKEHAIIWDLQTGEQKAVIKTYSKYCFDWVSTCRSDWDVLVFSPNSKILMTHNNKEVKFFNPENGELIYKSDDARSPTFWSSDGKLILSKSKEKGKISLWEITK